MDKQRHSLRGLQDAGNNIRRSQIVPGSTDIYGGKKTTDNSYGVKANMKLRNGGAQQLSQNMIGGSNVYNDRSASHTLNKSGLRNLSLAAKVTPSDSSLQYPATTKPTNGATSLRQVAGHSTLQTNLNSVGAQIAGGRRTESQPSGGKFPHNTTRSTKMSGQKLRKLPDGVRTVEVENMPSDISDDEWGEIQKFG